MAKSLFRAAEVMDMAIAIEEDGRRLYEACASSQLDPRVLDVFEYMVAQENKHIRIFEGMKDDLPDYELPETYPGEMQAYLASFAEQRVFDEAELSNKQCEIFTDHSAAIDRAVALERKSILFYSAVKGVVRKSEQDAIDEIIAQEHLHVRRLLELRRELEGRSDT
jgi:rubrerythrin